MTVGPREPFTPPESTSPTGGTTPLSKDEQAKEREKMDAIGIPKEAQDLILSTMRAGQTFDPTKATFAKRTVRQEGSSEDTSFKTGLKKVGEGHERIGLDEESAEESEDAMDVDPSLEDVMADEDQKEVEEALSGGAAFDYEPTEEERKKLDMNGQLVLARRMDRTPLARAIGEKGDEMSAGLLMIFLEPLLDRALITYKDDRIVLKLPDEFQADGLNILNADNIEKMSKGRVKLNSCTLTASKEIVIKFDKNKHITVEGLSLKVNIEGTEKANSKQKLLFKGLSKLSSLVGINIKDLHFDTKSRTLDMRVARKDVWFNFVQLGSILKAEKETNLVWKSVKGTKEAEKKEKAAAKALEKQEKAAAKELEKKEKAARKEAEKLAKGPKKTIMQSFKSVFGKGKEKELPKPIDVDVTRTMPRGGLPPELMSTSGPSVTQTMKPTKTLPPVPPKPDVTKTMPKKSPDKPESK